MKLGERKRKYLDDLETLRKAKRERKKAVRTSPEIREHLQPFFGAVGERLAIEYDIDRFNTLLLVEDDETHAAYLEGEIKRLTARLKELDEQLPELATAVGLG